MKVQAHGRTAVSPRGQAEPEVARELKRRLYEQIAPEAVARMAASDPERARAQVRTVLKSLLSSTYPATGRDVATALVDGVVADTIGLGAIDALMRDPAVTEVMVNGPHSIFFERAGRLHRHHAVFESSEQLRTIIDRLVAPVGRRVDERSPLVSARLSEGHRAHIALPPIAVDGPVLTVRKFSRQALSLGQLVEVGSMSQRVATLLVWAVRSRMNIAVSGGTGSGKTTLLNALAGEIDSGERIVTIEDSAELKFQRHPHVVRLEARQAGADGGGEVTIRDLVISSLRMRPDRIVVGEVRGAEALEMLQAMNTGHDGSLTTLHANSPREVPSRLATMVGYGGVVSREQVLDQVAGAIDVVVHVARLRTGERLVVELCEVGRQSADGSLTLRTVASTARRLGVADASPRRCPEWQIHNSCSIPGRAVEAGVATPEEVLRWRELP